MAKTARRPAAPEKYGEVRANVKQVEARLKELRATIDSGKVLKYRDVEKIGSAVASLLSRAASACW